MRKQKHAIGYCGYCKAVQVGLGIQVSCIWGGQSRQTSYVRSLLEMSSRWCIGDCYVVSVGETSVAEYIIRQGDKVEKTKKLKQENVSTLLLIQSLGCNEIGPISRN